MKRGVIVGLAAVAACASAAPAPAGAAPLRAALTADLAELKPGERLLVRVSGRHGRAVERATKTAGLRVVRAYRKVGVVEAVGTKAEILALHRSRAVAGVYPPLRLTPMMDSAMRATGVEALRAAPGLDALRRADGTPFDGTGVTIAVIDNGVDESHEMFVQDGESKVDVNLRQNCDAVQGTDVMFCTGFVPIERNENVVVHGTHVASIAAGYERTTPAGRTVSGAAPGARLAAIGVGDGAGVKALPGAVGIPVGGFDVLPALQWVLDHHEDPCGDGSCPPIRVLNLSLGCCFGEAYDPHVPENKLVSALAEDGVVVVWAAGNRESADTPLDGSANTMSMLALNPTPGVISVANHYDGEAGDRELGVHYSSARGKRGRPETYPDVSAPGMWVMSACPRQSWCPVLGGPGAFEDDYAYQSGTSMSAPHVAGLAAVVLEANPALTPAGVEDILEDSAFKFGEPAEYDPDAANTNDRTSFRAGHGLVDAVGAVSLALGRGPRSAPRPCAHTVAGSVSFADRFDRLSVAPHHDITKVDASWPSPGDVVSVDVHVVDLPPVSLAGPQDIYNVELQVDGEHIELYYSPFVAVQSATIWRGDATADAVYDADRDVIGFSIRLGESIETRRRLGGLGAWTSLINGTGGLVDFAYGACGIKGPGAS